MSANIFKCSNSAITNKCEWLQKNPPPDCDEIETIFTRKWGAASATERQKLEDLYTKLRTDPGNGSNSWCPKDSCTPETIQSACSQRKFTIWESDVDKFIKPVSDCEYIVQQIPTNLSDDWKTTILGEEGGIYDTYTSAKSCRFPDQDYGSDHTSAKSVCLEQAKYAQKHREAMEDKENLVEVVTGKIGSNAKAMNVMNTHLSISMKPKTLIDQVNMCSNVSTSSMSNTISSNCPSIFENNDTIETLLRAGYGPDEIKQLGRTTIKNVRQENNAEATQSCEMKHMLDTLLSMDASIDNSAMQEALAKSEQLGSNAESINNMCTEISVDISPCKYIAQTNCCNNVVNNEMTNNLTVGCNTDVDRIVQRNAVNNIQSCQVSAQSNISEEMASAIFNVSSQSSETSSVGFNLGVVIIGIVIVVCVFAAVTLYIYSLNATLITSIIGGFLTLSGIGLITFFFRTYKKEEQLINDPYSLCDGSTNFEDPSRMTFEEAVNRFNDVDDIKGFDFFPDEKIPGEVEGEDETLEDPSSIPPNWLGLATFMSDVNRGEQCKIICKDDTVEDIDECKEEDLIKSWSHAKIRSYKIAIWSGLIMFIVGLVIAIVPWMLSSSSAVPASV